MRFFGFSEGEGTSNSSGFSASSTAEQVTQGIDGTALTAIVTGSSSGIGIETARVLAMRGVRVVMAIRNVNAGKKVKEDIIKEIPTAKIEVMELDLSSMESVRKFATEYNSSGNHLHILINNAGIYGIPFMLSIDNIELQFATNHLGPFLLTNLLLETMKKTVSETKIEGRIVNVSSVSHDLLPSEGIRFEKISDESSYNSAIAYGQSKLANVLHANELARRFKDEEVNITANSLHPGVIDTNIMRHRNILRVVIKFLSKIAFKNIPQGASTQCYVALHPQLKGVSGKYFVDNNETKLGALGTNVELAKKLWDFSLSLTNSN